MEKGKTAMLPTGKRKRGKSPGFTLMELVVVLAILGLFVPVLVLRMESVLTGGDIRLASRIIMSEILKTRGEAARTRKEQVLGIHMEENAVYRLDPSFKKSVTGDQVFQSLEKGQNYRKLPEGTRVDDVLVLVRGKIQEGEAQIRFFANGTIERTLIHLSNDKGEVYTLELNPFTGHVLIHDRYVDQKIL